MVEFSVAFFSFHLLNGGKVWSWMVKVTNCDIVIIKCNKQMLYVILIYSSIETNNRISKLRKLHN